jgi:hypothetical protein
MSEFTPLREAVDTLASRTPSPDFGELKRRATRRGRRRVVMAAVATAAVVAGSVLGITGLEDGRRTAPVEQPKPVVGAVPVWYDAKGLHRGDVVEQTPVEIGVLDGVDTVTLKGALALVRSGAVYLDPATGDVWFHPWGGDPRIVGHNSAAGPGGDPNGDTAVWFEGFDPLNATHGELVVYDTAAGREISRTTQSHGVTGCVGGCGDHRPPGNGFLQVSAERVVWQVLAEPSGLKTYSHDVRTRTTSEVKTPKERYRIMDVHGDVEVFGEHGSFNLVLKAPGGAEERYPDLEWFGRLSPSGNYVQAVEDTKERHGAVIVDTRTGELWRVPKNVYPLIAWSYGDIAMVDHIEDGRRIGALLACDAARRTCERLPAERAILMPTN